MKQLRQITVIGLGLLGGSVTLTILRTFAKIKVVGYSHRASTRQKARELAVATEVVDDLRQSVCKADLVILATPIYTFENIFEEIGDVLPKDCVVTDIGSTKVLPHRWAAKGLPKSVYYVGSHPIAGSEQRGIEFARDDLFDKADCIVTTTKSTNSRAIQTLKSFWLQLGCRVKIMSPAEHDKIFASVSHIPHITAAALLNSNSQENLKFAGKGFMDTSRIASGPANIWVDILTTNTKNNVKGIDKIISELEKFKKALKAGDTKKVENLLKAARAKRASLISHKLKSKELIS